MVTRVKGTQDFLDLTLFNMIIDRVTKHCALYQFNQIATPLLEYTELFKRSLGTQTDVVSKEMFLIEPHAEDTDAQICLRPEATASIVRAFIEGGIQTVPWKVFTWGPMFRYERPQKGRYRQFHQVSVEVIGAASIMHDVELLVMFDRLFHEGFGLNNYALQINFLGCMADRQAYRSTLYDIVKNKHYDQICSLCKDRLEKNIMRIFDCKNQQCQEIYAKVPKISDHLCKPCATEWATVKEQLDMLSISYIHEPRLVRGLDYYSKTVFEFVSGNLGAQNAFCAGGRYDQLVTHLGGKEDQPSIGAAIGIERLMLLLADRADQAAESKQALTVIVPMGIEQQTVGLLLADELRATGISVDLLLEGSFKSMMRRANKLGAKYALLIGEDEQASRQVTLKNMVTGEQERIAQTEVASRIRS